MRIKKELFSKIYTIIILIFIVAVTAGCGGSDGFTIAGKVNVITSFYPLYDFTQKIGGEHVHAVNLVPAGVEPHDWTPKPRDMKNMAKADMFIYNGAGFEGWVDDFLDSLKKDTKLVVVEATEGVNLIKADHDADHDFDPHAWLSPLQAIVMADNIKDYLTEIDPANKAEYEVNYQALVDRLHQLDHQLSETVIHSFKKEIVVSHEAFGYIARDYGITQVGVMGLSPESEPTVQRMKEITEFAKEHNVKYILFEELDSPKLAETLANTLNIETLVLNPLEGLTKKQMDAGEDFFSIMEKNLTSIEKALQ